MKNPYDILGVDKTASQEEVKKAYYQKSKESHPDIGGASGDFQVISSAYNILSNPDSRKIFDETGVILGDTASMLRQQIQSTVREMSMEWVAAKIGNHGKKVKTWYDFVVFTVDSKVDNINAQKIELNRQKLAAKGLMDLISVSDGDNMFNRAVEQTINMIEDSIGQADAELHKFKLIKEELEKYNSHEIVTPDDIPSFFTGTAASW